MQRRDVLAVIPFVTGLSMVSDAAAAEPKVPIVLVHGLHCGGWIWRYVAPFLQHAGHQVITPTLTGTGDRAHLLSREITLETHIEDVLSVVDMLDLPRFALVGHSYGGMVVSCVADRMRDRIAKLIYLDALIAQPGLSAFDILPKGMATIRRERARIGGADVAFPVPPENAVFLPDADRKAWFMRHLRPHPVGTYETPARLERPAGAGLSVTYIAYENPALGSIEPSRAFARAQPGWHYHSEAVPHDAEIVFPERVASLITGAL